MAKKFQQDPGINVGETFSPVAKIATVRVILAIATSLNWPVKHIDINNAFLNGSLQEHVFMSQPECFISSAHPQHVRKLNKALYGLKQAPTTWNDKLRNTLLQWGLHHTKSDHSYLFSTLRSKLL